MRGALCVIEFHEAGEFSRVVGVLGDVGVFVGVGIVIVEFDGVDVAGEGVIAVDPNRQAEAIGAHGVAHEFGARVLAEGDGFEGLVGGVEKVGGGFTVEV